LDGVDMTDVIKDRPSEQVARGSRAPFPPGASASRFCIFCGAPLPAEALFCARCGRPQPQVTGSLPLAPLSYPVAATTPLQQALSPIQTSSTFVGISPSATGSIIATIANAGAVLAFFALPFGAATSLAGPQLASLTSQNASLICPAV